MRPQQQNRRMRGRNNNNNNRKGPNPLTRNYESNGPDVKIRGSAQQIAEKYTTLARDAQSAGDRVIAENYLQHAEHYNRIIAAAQAQMPQQQPRDNRDNADDDGDDERGDQNSNEQAAGGREDRGNQNGGGQDRSQNDSSRNERPQNERRDREQREIRADQQSDDGSGPQPVIEGTPAEVALNQSRNGNSEQQANGAGDDGQGDAPQRKPRRPRRKRSDANGEGVNGGEAHADGVTAPEAGDAPARNSAADNAPAVQD